MVHDRDGCHCVRAGGVAMTYVQINGQSGKKNLLTMESIAIPLELRGAGVGCFGGLMAAALPLVVGVLAILGLDGGCCGPSPFSPTSRSSH